MFWGACSRSQVGAATPRAAMEWFTAAFAKGDLAALESIVHGSSEEFEALAAMVEFLRAGDAFRDAMVKQYGAKGWTEFQDAADAQLRLVTPGSFDLNKMKLEVTGHLAHARIEGASVTRLERKDGRWWIPLDQFMGGNVARATRVFRATTKCVREFQLRIGTEGETADTIDAAMAPALLLASRTR